MVDVGATNPLLIASSFTLLEFEEVCTNESKKKFLSFDIVLLFLLLVITFCF